MKTRVQIVDRYLKIFDIEDIRPGSLMDEYLNKFEEIVQNTIEPDSQCILDPRVWCALDYLKDSGLDSFKNKKKVKEIAKKLKENDEKEMLNAICYTMKKIKKDNS